MKSAAYLAAWRVAPKIPEPILRGLANLAADLVWLRRGKGIRRLESNYARVRPELSPSQIRALSRQGMQSYFRYFREAFTLSAVSESQLAARVKVRGAELVFAALRDYGSPVIALGHAGNWDLAGAWGAIHLAPVLTVAEKLEPARLFEAFLTFRSGLGIKALGLGDSGIFQQLVAGAREGGWVIPLLADRDLTARGVEATLLGQTVRVAAGPARVALTAGVPLLLATIHYQRLRGQQRQAAGSPWGIVIEFIQIGPGNKAISKRNAIANSHDGADANLETDAQPPTPAQVSALTQAWVIQFGQFLQRHTQDWHMLQAVFIDDLDADRYARTRAQASGIEAGE